MSHVSQGISCLKLILNSLFSCVDLKELVYDLVKESEVESKETESMVNLTEQGWLEFVRS